MNASMLMWPERLNTSPLTNQHRTFPRSDGEKHGVEEEREKEWERERERERVGKRERERERERDRNGEYKKEKQESKRGPNKEKCPIFHVLV